jgi:hypothetical protein
MCSIIFLYRRASSAGEHSEDHFLTVPKSMTASSSAETLTGNILLTSVFVDLFSFVCYCLQFVYFGMFLLTICPEIDDGVVQCGNVDR